MYRIRTFNKISPVGLNRLDPALYAVSDSETDEDAILVEGLNRHYYRVAVRNRGENERLINILKEVQSEEKHNVNL